MNLALGFLYRQALPALACFAAAWAFMQTSLGQRLENLTLDERSKVNLEGTVSSDALALISIDETSIRELGRWPWDRGNHRDLLQLLSRVRPSVVTWDILFTEPSAADDELARAIASNRSVVLGAKQVDDSELGLTSAAAVSAGVHMDPLTRIIGDRGGIPTSIAMEIPAGGLAKVAKSGFVDTPPDDDGVLRRAPLLIRIGDDVYPSLSLRTLMEYWGATSDDVTVRLGESIFIDAPLARRRIPIDFGGVYTINFRHTRAGFAEYGYSSTWIALQKRFMAKEPVKIPPLTGRILLVGQVADGLSDFGPTPVSPLTPLMLVHANVMENVLLEDYVKPVAPGYVWLGALLVGIAGVARFSNRKPLDQAMFSIGMPVAFIAAATFAWINGSWIIPIVGPLLGFIWLQGFMIARRMIAELRAKEQIKGMFGTYVSPELVSRLVAAGCPPELGGHEEEISAFFSDIQEFSTFSEVLSPSQLVELMNEYLTTCTDVIQSEGGTLDKYIGDAVVAMFGAPVRLPDHSYRACVAAVRIQHELVELRRRWQVDGRWPVPVHCMRSRIGLNTGRCVIGNMGSRTRFNYTMMGDNVNLAARMESGAKTWGTYSMCTEATRSACDTHAPGQVIFRPLGRIQVKGRAAVVPIFEIAALKEACRTETCECIALFSEGLEFYYLGDWDRAASRFRESAALEPLVPGKSRGVRTNPSLVYLELIERFRRESPSVGWNGVYVMTEK